MTILTKDILLHEIAEGHLRIEPFDPEQVGPGSIDLTLSRDFRVFEEGKTISVTDTIDYRAYTRPVHVEDYIEILPGQTVLGMTRERIFMPRDLVGWLEGRSRFARIGLLIHVSSNFVHPGVENRQVLEIRNVSPNRLRLFPGTRICQLVVERAEGEASYEDQFKEQTDL
ncbi:dCTP deaminase [Candidatus Woesearchaeota archaeon]|nr:dCTP deaminase [Candidatus Woesearchaeota archaeon]